MYIGWDIGIKNLAYCIIDNSNEEIIKEINIINLIDEPIIYKCTSNNKNGKQCNSKSLYVDKKNENVRYCNKHYLALGIKEQKLVKKKKRDKKCKDYSLEEIGLNLFKALDNNPLFLECNNIIIENQPVLKNPTMKSIQIMLYSYFLIKNKNINIIKLVNASNKTKVYKGPDDDELKKIKEIKDKYKRTKKMAVKHCQLMIKDNKILDYFNSHKKNDDLADAYLMTKYLININK